MNRREFNGHLSRAGLVVAIGGATFALEGCNVIQDIINWEPVAEDSFNAILNILSVNGISLAPVQVAIAAVDAALVALKAAAQEYQSTSPTPVGALAKLQAALKAVVDNIGTFLQALNIGNVPLLNIIAGLAQIIFSTIAAFQNQLPTAIGLAKTTLVGATIRVAQTVVPVVPKTRTKRAFKKDWNGTLDSGKNALGIMVPETAYLKLSLFERL